MSYWAPMVLLLALAINMVSALGLAWGVTTQAACIMVTLSMYLGLQALLHPMRFRDLEVCAYGMNCAKAWACVVGV